MAAVQYWGALYCGHSYLCCCSFYFAALEAAHSAAASAQHTAFHGPAGQRAAAQCRHYIDHLVVFVAPSDHPLRCNGEKRSNAAAAESSSSEV
jgi:hypothetical protein